MILVHSTDNSEFRPISYGESYLYDQYDKLFAFLSVKSGVKEANRLAKPIRRDSNFFDWYANVTTPLSRISVLAENDQNNIKVKYKEFRSSISKLVQQLQISDDKEKKAWADLLNKVFNDDDNIILSNGVDWVILWGWQFHNSSENYILPNFAEVKIYDKGEIKVNENEIEEKTEVEQEEPFVDYEEYDDGNPIDNSFTKTKMGLFGRFFHWLRWFAYRFWGLMLLIIILLFLICLFRCWYNNGKNYNDNTIIDENFNKIERELDRKCP